ncbi:MAG: DUF697 domain-containing protein [Synergistaceae bacterium]|jgi:uncharacterized protein (DUF697 family)|nr:DUF697 domain-containing protein [Synergistaceae bacterium]
MKLDERIKVIIEIYDNLEEILDSLPDVIPGVGVIKDQLKKAILDDKELKYLIDDLNNDNLKNKRPQMLVKLADKFTKIFSSISATIALTPIPLADVFILCALQGVLVALIAALGGRKLTLEAAGEFVVSMGGVGVVGFGLRTAAQQAVKLLNIFPGAGSTISAGIAATGTVLVGRAARKYYLQNMSMDAVIKNVRRRRRIGRKRPNFA